MLRPQNKVCGAQHEFYTNSCFRGSVWSIEAQDLRLNPAFITNVICTLCSFCESGRLQRFRFLRGWCFTVGSKKKGDCQKASEYETPACSLASFPGACIYWQLTWRVVGPFCHLQEHCSYTLTHFSVSLHRLEPKANTWTIYFGF